MRPPLRVGPAPRVFVRRLDGWYGPVYHADRDCAEQDRGWSADEAETVLMPLRLALARKCKPCRRCADGLPEVPGPEPVMRDDA